MELNSITVAVRPRTPWEAVDLGVRMGRRWWWPMVRVWLVLSLPLAILLPLVVGDHLWAAPLVLWWTKPLWERALLYMLSQVMFGHLPSTREALRAFPAQLRPDLLASMTWRRLNPCRSMDAPVAQLEGLHGRRRAERVALLRRQDSQPAAWLTLIGVHLEAFLALAALVLAAALVPSTVDVNLDELAASSIRPQWLIAQTLLAYAAATLVAPFYVATGFALYLNRRIRLEGWDIDIAFRRMVQKHARADAPARPGAPAAALLAVALVTGGAGVPFPAEAAPAPEESREAITAILAGEDFARTKTVKSPTLFDGSGHQWDLFDMPDWWSDLFRALAGWLEIIFWALVVLMALFVALRYRHWLRALGSREPSPPTPAQPDTLFGLDLRRDSLPEDLPGQVQALWNEQRCREALGLLYRGSLIGFIDAGARIGEGDTEGDCLARVRPYASERAFAFFVKVTGHWQGLAYAHQQPPDDAVHALCGEWRQLWSTEVSHA